MSEQKGPLRLLSLDGGGIRGLSELLILEEILKRVKNQLGLQKVPLPCDYFDMIGGTSTGGLVALMLGRLGMSVRDAIDCYEALAGKVFRDVKPRGRDGRFKATKLKEAIQNIVKGVATDTEELMMNPEFGGRQCKTFVCAMPALNLGAAHLFRSYPAPKYETANCTIWEAARATSAAPTFFKRITIGSPGIAYVDGGMRCNNPTEQMLNEIALIFPGQEVHCLVSIGTGQAHTIKVPKPNLFQGLLPTDVAKALQGIATDCEGVAQRVAQLFQSQKRSKVYFRFNVEQGMQDIELSHWERLGEVATHTEQYMRMVEVDQKLDSAVLAIQRRSRAAVIPGPEPLKTPIQFRSIYSTTFKFDHEPRDAAESQQCYHRIVPHEPLDGYRLSVGDGALSLKFNGSGPVRWISILDDDLSSPVRVETTVDLSRCNTTKSPSGAGVLVILPDEKNNSKARKFFFIVEPSDSVPQLHVLKQKLKPGDGWAFLPPLYSETLLHCQGQRNVQVEVTVLSGTITVSANGVVSTVLRMPTSGGPNRLRAFGLCGIGPQRLTWTSFKVSVGRGQSPSGPPTDSGDEDPDLTQAIKLSLREENARSGLPLARATNMRAWNDHDDR